jgi:hypothetical protein
MSVIMKNRMHTIIKHKNMSSRVPSHDKGPIPPLKLFVLFIHIGTIRIGNKMEPEQI